jgi:hypothetical protein
MTPLLRASRNLLLLPLLVAGATLAARALVPTEWQHRQALGVAAPGLVRLELPAATFDAAAPQQQDLRVLDPAGREVALLLDNPPLPVRRTQRPAAFATRLQDDATVLTLTTGTRAPLSAVTLETPAPFFLRAARVEVSDDDSTWTPLDDGLPLFRQWGAEQLQLPLGEHAAAYVRVTIGAGRGGAVPFTGATLHLAAGPAPAQVPVGARLTGRDEFAGETVLTVTLDGRHLPLAALTLETPDALFMRRVTVAVREVQGLTAPERVIGAGTIYRVALDGTPVRARLDLPLDYSPATRELLVHIHNGDSPPLTVTGVSLQRRPVAAYFYAAVAGPHQLLSGNPQAPAPHYDLAALAGDLRTASVQALTPGALEDTPAYHPRDSLAEPSLPEVPLVGAPLDAHDWPVRAEVRLARAGVQELELDPAALAGARSDYADLRLLRAGNQIPYLLELPALSRILPHTAVAVPDPHRPSVSVWKIQLAQAGLPCRQVALTTATPLFQRQFRFYEKVKGTDGRTDESTLGTGAWSRTPDPGVPAAHTFELSGRLQTDTLWIETDNGDNPPLALSQVQVTHPVVRLVFKVAETDGLALAYGNRAANAPRYDLDLVAAKLLTSPRGLAHLGAAETVAGASLTNPFSSLEGGYLFWGVLVLVVVALLVIVAKLLPKPPAG